MKIMRTLLTLTLAGFFTLSYANMEEFNKESSEKVKAFVKKNQIEIVDFKYVQQQIGKGTRKSAKALVLDARPLKKYQMGHIPSSVALPDNKYIQYKQTVLKGISKTKPIITYCGGYKCMKSHKLAVMLKQDGFTDVKVFAQGMPVWKKHSYAEIDLNIAKALFDKKSALFLDARPYGKFFGGTIVGSLSIPDKKFDKYLGFMPNDKKTTIVTFCGGFACAKSHNIAEKLYENGYKNVKVLASGFPAWKKAQFPSTNAKGTKVAKKSQKAAPSKGFLKAGEDTGTVDGEWFVKNYKKFPKNVYLVNVMSKDEFNKGHIKGSINIHAEELKPKELLAKLPKEGEIIFYCGTGTRAMEAWGMLAEDLKYKEISRVKYLDANIKCDKQPCNIEPNEPLGV